MDTATLNLVKKSMKQDRKAQKLLYGQYSQKWFLVCLRYGRDKAQAEDMLQDGLVSIFSNLKQFNPQKGNFSQWSHRIMVNASLQYLRKWHRLDFEDDLEQYQDKVDNVENIYDIIGAKELTQLIQKLPNGYRVVFNMYVVEGYKHQEIAEILQISVGTSKSQLAKAKKMLRNRLEILLQT